MDTNDPPDPMTAVEAAVELRRLASALRESSRFPHIAKATERTLRRYAPFLDELAAQTDFCRDLAACPLAVTMPEHRRFDHLDPLSNRARLPHAPPYTREGWLELFTLARFRATASPRISRAWWAV